MHNLRLGPVIHAVRDMGEALDFYVDVVGGVAGTPHVVAADNGDAVRCFVDFGGTSIQLLQPNRGNTSLHTFLQRYGEGVCGQVFVCDDIERARDEAVRDGLQTVGEIIGLGDMRELLIHPHSTHGVLWVLRQHCVAAASN